MWDYTSSCGARTINEDFFKLDRLSTSGYIMDIANVMKGTLALTLLTEISLEKCPED